MEAFGSKSIGRQFKKVGHGMKGIMLIHFKRGILLLICVVRYLKFRNINWPMVGNQTCDERGSPVLITTAFDIVKLADWLQVVGVDKAYLPQDGMIESLFDYGIL